MGRESKELEQVLPHGTSWSWRPFAVCFLHVYVLQLQKEQPQIIGCEASGAAMGGICAGLRALLLFALNVL